MYCYTMLKLCRIMTSHCCLVHRVVFKDRGIIKTRVVYYYITGLATIQTQITSNWRILIYSFNLVIPDSTRASINESWWYKGFSWPDVASVKTCNVFEFFPENYENNDTNKKKLHMSLFLNFILCKCNSGYLFTINNWHRYNNW